MGETLIGIKMADQTFYPVMEEGYQGKKKLVLTTVRDNQNTVQIDLYKSSDKMLDPSLYVGSLVIENIEDARKGEPEIEVILGIDEHKNLNAVARNLKTGTKQRLQTSLENLDEHETYDIPDFELEEEGQSRTPIRAGTVATDDKTIVGGNYPLGGEDRRKSYLREKDKSPVGKIVAITLVVLVLIGLAGLIVAIITKNISLPRFDSISSNQKPQPTNLVVENVRTKAPKTSTPPTKAPEPTKAKVVPTKAPTDKDLTKAIPTQNTVKINGISYIEYRIVWGDTLWWIANKYYGNPWMYKKIYRFEKNKLKDPDLIIAGTKLYIPKK